MIFNKIVNIFKTGKSRLNDGIKLKRYYIVMKFLTSFSDVEFNEKI